MRTSRSSSPRCVRGVVSVAGAECAGAGAAATTAGMGGAGGGMSTPGVLPVWLEADAPRVSCPEHAVVVAHVPWARHGAGHTTAFDDTVAWLAVATARSTVCQLLRIAWRTVGAIVTRVAQEFGPAWLGGDASNFLSQESDYLSASAGF